MNKVWVFGALMVAANSAHAWKLVADPLPATDPQYSVLSHCKFYVDTASPLKQPVVATGGKHCELVLDGLSLSNGSHSVQATHLIDHPTSPLESAKSNTVTFVWPIPPAPTGTLPGPQGWRLVAD